MDALKWQHFVQAPICSDCQNLCCSVCTNTSESQPLSGDLSAVFLKSYKTERLYGCNSYMMQQDIYTD